jgi:hypothetical protein
MVKPKPIEAVAAAIEVAVKAAEGRGGAGTIVDGVGVIVQICITMVP